MNAHTPGPWRIVPGEKWQRPACIYAGRDDICRISGDVEGTGPDARLIAAAPDMLEALRRSLKALEYTADKSGTNSSYVLITLDDIHAAIDKATGGKS